MLSFPGGWRRAAGAGCAAFPLLVASCAQQSLHSGPLREIEPALGHADGPGEGEKKKQWSGRSLAAQTLVAQLPTASTLAGGFDQERVWGGSDDWEPAVAADPGEPYVYQMTTRYGGAQVDVIFRRSLDGGATWSPDLVLAGNAGDPMIEVADDGTVFAIALVGGGYKVQLTRSFDHGVTWTPLEGILGPGQPNWGDRPVLAISPDGQDVYVAFNQSDSYVVASHDQGESFAAPVQTSDDSRYWFHSAGAVAPNGDVYFAAADYAQDYSGPTHINVLRSTDGGTSWTTTRVDSSAAAPDCAWSAGCYLGFLGPEVGLAVDASGLVMIAYNAGDVAGASQNLWVRTSPDGDNWSSRQMISSTAAGVNNAFAAIVAGRSTPGDFRIVWQDDRVVGQVGWNTWIRRTLDGGGSWGPSERISDLDSGAPYKSSAGYSFVYGDYLEVATDGQDVDHIIWGEGTSYTGPGGSWYTRGIAVPEPAAWLSLAVGIGLLSAFRSLGRR